MLLVEPTTQVPDWLEEKGATLQVSCLDSGRTPRAERPKQGEEPPGAGRECWTRGVLRLQHKSRKLWAQCVQSQPKGLAGRDSLESEPGSQSLPHQPHLHAQSPGELPFTSRDRQGPRGPVFRLKLTEGTACYQVDLMCLSLTSPVCSSLSTRARRPRAFSSLKSDCTDSATPWVESLSALLLSSWKTLSTLFNILEPQLPHLKNGTMIMPFHRTIRWMYMKY